MQLRAYVLHLERAEKRRGNAQQLLKDCGLAGLLWPAADGAALPADVISQAQGKRLFKPHYPFDLKLGEIGCFLSHRAIWADMQKRPEEAALIIEDDASISPAQFTQAMAMGTHHIKKLGYIQLQTRPGKGTRQLLDKCGGPALFVPQVSDLRTTAQLVSKQAASQLLRLSQKIDRPVDTFVQSHWHTGLRAAAIYPSGISDIADQLDGTTIQGGQKTTLEKLQREVQRTLYRLRVARHSRRSAAPVEGGQID